MAECIELRALRADAAGEDFAVARVLRKRDAAGGEILQADWRVAEIYIERPDDLQMLWHGGPKTLLHGDTHIGNVFFDHGRTGFLDWGIMNVNTPMRELSYFLTMALTPDDRRANERELIELYLGRWNAGGGEPISFDEAWTAHRIHAAYTVPASCQVVMFPEAVSERRRIFADAFLDRAQQSLDDLDALGALRARGF